jgi:hypothetical protein
MTDSVVMINPYRPTQLYNTDLNGALSTNLNDCRAEASPSPGNPSSCTTRLQNPDTLPLPSEITSQFANASTTAAFHELIAATAFGSIVWNVCAPSPRPALARSVGYNYKFIVRTGISVSLLNSNATTGCVQIVAHEAETEFVPASLDPLHHNDDTWRWNAPFGPGGAPAYDSEGFTDINSGMLEEPQGFCVQHGLPPTCTIQALIAYMLHNAGSSEAKAQNDPITDRYDPLRALAGAGTLGTSPAVIGCSTVSPDGPRPSLVGHNGAFTRPVPSDSRSALELEPNGFQLARGLRDGL